MWRWMTLLTAGFFHLLLHSVWSNWCNLLLDTGYWLKRSWVSSEMTAAWYMLFSAWHRDDTIFLRFVFPVCLCYILSGARAASVAFGTSLQSLQCDCIKIIKKSQACSHTNYYAKSGGGGKNGWDFFERLPAQVQTQKVFEVGAHSISLKELLMYPLPLFRSMLSTYILWHLFTSLNYFPFFF